MSSADVSGEPDRRRAPCSRRWQRCDRSGWTWTRSARRPASPRPPWPGAPNTWRPRSSRRSGGWRSKQFGRGTLGLHVGTAFPKGNLLDYLASTSPTLRAALGQIARYIGLDSQNVRWVLGAREADGLTMFEQQMVDSAAVIPPQLWDFSIAIAASRVRERFDRRPREVWFAHAPLGPADEYEQVLGCPVRFERDRTGLRFDDDALEAPARDHDPNLFRLLESHAARVLAETPVAATLRERVRNAVVQRLRDGEPGIGNVAEALAMSERSLQRKLQTEGVSFRDVVDEARHKLAVVYLGDVEPVDDRRRLPARVRGGCRVHARVQALDRPRAQSSSAARSAARELPWPRS